MYVHLLRIRVSEITRIDNYFMISNFDEKPKIKCSQFIQFKMLQVYKFLSQNSSAGVKMGVI